MVTTRDNQNFFLVKGSDKGDEILKEIGVEKDKKVVCIYARDAAYLNQVYLYTIGQDTTIEILILKILMIRLVI